MTTYGPIGRLGGWTATHFKAVVIAWGVLALGLGFFAPKVETALSGAGWESTGSESVAARKTIDKNFQGLSSSALMVVVHSSDKTVSDPAFQKTVASTQRVLKSDSRVKSVVPPQPGRRSRVTATPRSCRRVRHRMPTPWCGRPTTSRPSCIVCRATACRSL